MRLNILVAVDKLNRAKTSQQRAFYFSWCLLLRKGNIGSLLQGKHSPCKFWVGRLFKLFQSVFLTLTQYQLKEICLKFPKIEATGGVKTHPGLPAILMLLPARARHGVRAAAPGAACMVLRVLVLCGHSRRGAIASATSFLCRSAWPLETSSLLCHACFPHPGSIPFP